MRIALALHGWPPEAMGGTGLYVRALARALVSLGQEVALLAPTPGSRPELREVPGVPGTTAHLLAGPPLTRWEQTWTQPARAALLGPWLERVRPELLHLHHLSGLPWSLPAEARRRGARVVLTLHDYALPCARGQLVDRDLRPCPGPEPARCAACLSEQLALDPTLARLGRLLGRLPTLRARARRLAGAGGAGERGARRVAARNTALHEMFRSVDVALAPSEDLARRFEGLGLGRPRRCELPLLHSVPPAPDPGQGPLRFLFASALIPTKGPDRLLEAFARLPPGRATLTLVGPEQQYDSEPDFISKLRARARATPGVRLLGPVAPDQMAGLLAAHDVLVLPSRWPENSPLIVREATAAGLRVIVGAEGGARELAPEARVVPAADPGERVLEQALQAEIVDGRARRPPRAWPDPLAHARWLLEEVYGR